MKSKIFFILFFPHLLFSQNFKKIATISVDTFEQTFITPFEDFVCIGGVNGRKSKVNYFVTPNGQTIRPTQFPIFFNLDPRSSNTLLRLEEDNKFGLGNQLGKLVTPIEYDFLQDYFREEKILGKKGNDWYLIDSMGTTTIFPTVLEYEEMEVIGNNIILATRDSRQQLIDCDEKPITQKTYQAIKPSQHPHLFILNDNKWKSRGLFSTDIGVLLEPKPFIFIDVLKNQIIVENKKEKGVKLYNLKGDEIDTKGKLINKYLKDFGYIFKIQKGNFSYYGWCDAEFNEILPAKYVKYQFNINGFLILTTRNNQFEIFNTNREQVYTDKTYNVRKIEYLSKNDFIVRKKKQKHYWYNGKGEELLNKPFFKLLKRYSFSHKTIRGDFSYETLAVKRKDSLGLIQSYLYDRSGQQIGTTTYDSIYYFNYSTSLFLFIKNDKFGLLNSKGEILLPAKYDSIKPILLKNKNRIRGVSFFEVKKDNQIGLTNYKGDFIVPLSEEVNDVKWIKEKYLWVTKRKQIEVFEYVEKE